MAVRSGTARLAIIRDEEVRDGDAQEVRSYGVHPTADQAPDGQSRRVRADCQLGDSPRVAVPPAHGRGGRSGLQVALGRGASEEAVAHAAVDRVAEDEVGRLELRVEGDVI